MGLPKRVPSSGKPEREPARALEAATLLANAQIAASIMAVELDRFYNRTRAARKIVVVDLGFLGDSIHLVPALWEIKRHYPEAGLHTVSARVGAELLGLAPCVDRAWTFPLGPKSPPWWRHWDVLRELRRARFDLAFNFSGADRTIFLTALTGARWRLGHPGGRSHFWNKLLIPCWTPRQNADLPVYEQRRQVLVSAGFVLEPPRFDLQLPSAARDWAAGATPPNAVHLSINASTFLKEWPLPNWIELARLLLDQHPSLRLVATTGSQPREQARCARFAAAVRDPRLEAIPAGLPLARLAALVARCRVHVGADSGVLHLAMAMGTPTVAVFRQYGGLNEWLPHGLRHRHVSAACACAPQPQPPCLHLGYAECLAGIPPRAVASLIQECLAE
jgi:ADP-heptose:LPS heptosyltransferase